jgi:hypothetical protein
MADGAGKLQRHAAALAAAVLLAAVASVSTSRAQNYSHARIVRLSFVQGTVSVSRPGVAEWSQAPVNTPIQQGFKVATAANSFAEIEFENASTARLGEESELDFNELALAPSGAKINRMTMVAGYGTFDVIPETGDVYTVTAGQSVLRPSGRAIFRVDLNSTAERVEVFRGVVNVSSPYGSGQLTRNDVLQIDPTTRAYVVTHGIKEDAWDRWVQKRDQVLLAERGHSVPAGFSSYASPYAGLYGWNELSYYGDWTDVPGYGFGWSPFASAGWMPFSYGQWAWYPGFGWTWVDYDPWGWLPFHYGNWAFISDFGWMWFPGDFGYWSPACVTWYQGNGWVGWSPGVVRTWKGSSGAVGGRNFILGVRTGTFRTGRAINPADVLREPPQVGERVATPNLAPTLSAYLPGTATQAPNLRPLRIIGRPSPILRGAVGPRVSPNSPVTRVTSGARTLLIGSRTQARTGVPAPTVVLPRETAFAGTKAGGKTPAGIIFDSHTGEFVNNPNIAPPGARGRESITLRPGSTTTGAGPATVRLLAPKSGSGATVAPAFQSQAPAPTAPKRQGWLSRLFGGRSAPRTTGGGKAMSGGRQMQLGRPMNAPRGGQSAPHTQSRPSFGRSESPRQSGGLGGGVHESAPRMSGGFGGERAGGGSGGGEVHSAPASAGRPR